MKVFTRLDRMRDTGEMMGLPWSYWVKLITVATAIRVLAAFVLSVPFMDDALSYYQEGSRLLGNFPGEEAYFWPPGLPYVLFFAFSLFGHSTVVASIVAVIISVGVVVLTTCMSTLVLKNLDSRRMAGWIAAFYPPDVMMADQIYSHPLAKLCLLLTALFLILGYERKYWGYFALAGAGFGWAIVTRPSVFSVGLVLLGVWILIVMRNRYSTQLDRSLLVGPAAFLVVTLGIVLPVMHYNSVHGAGWTLSWNNERNFFIGNTPYTPNYKTTHLAQRSLDELEPEERAYLESFYVLGREESRRVMMQAAIQYIQEHPGITLWRTLSRVRAFWGFDYNMSRQAQRHHGWGLRGFVPLLLIEGGGYCALVIMALPGLFCSRGQWHMRKGVFLLLLAIGYQLPYMLAISGGPYHFPVTGFLVPFAAVALSSARASNNNGYWNCIRSNRWLSACAVLFLLFQIEYGYYHYILFHA